MLKQVAIVVISGIILNTATAYLATTKRAEFNSARIETLEANSVHQERFNEYVCAQQKYLSMLEKNVDRNEADIKEAEKIMQKFIMDYSKSIHN